MKTFILYTPNRQRTEIKANVLIDKFMNSKYIKNQWNSVSVKDRIIMFIANELKLSYSESQNKEALAYVERELLRKLNIKEK